MFEAQLWQDFQKHKPRGVKSLNCNHKYILLRFLGQHKLNIDDAETQARAYEAQLRENEKIHSGLYFIKGASRGRRVGCLLAHWRSRSGSSVSKSSRQLGVLLDLYKVDNILLTFGVDLRYPPPNSSHPRCRTSTMVLNSRHVGTLIPAHEVNKYLKSEIFGFYLPLVNRKFEMRVLTPHCERNSLNNIARPCTHIMLRQLRHLRVFHQLRFLDLAINTVLRVHRANESMDVPTRLFRKCLRRKVP